MKDAVTKRLRRISEATDSPETFLREVYHIPVLLVLMGFALAARLRRLGRFQREGDVIFSGNDAYYHFRQTTYLIDHFPSTMPFDTFTNYASGTNVDQFGTFYDQIVSGVILLTSFGDPSSEYAGLLMLIAAPVFLTATIIPIYLISAHFAGRWPALVAVGVFALFPGTVLSRTLVGSYDHPAAEILFQTLGVLMFVLALSVAQDEKPVWELVADRDFLALRRPLLYSTGAGVAAALYMWAWPPGILLIGISGLFLSIKITSDVYHDQSPEPVAFVGAVSMTVTAALMVAPITSYVIGSPSKHTLLQVFLPLAVAAGCVFLSWLARIWEQRSIDQSRYPISVGVLLVAVAAFTAVVLPGLVGTIESNLLRFVGFSAGAGTRTIGEAQPFLQFGNWFGIIYTQYRFTLFTAIVAALVFLGRPLVYSDDDRDTIYAVTAVGIVGGMYLLRPVYNGIAETVGIDPQVLGILIIAGLLVGATLRHQYNADRFYLVVWGGFITSAAFTQVRFNYYLAVVVAVFTALFVAQVASLIDLRKTADSISESARSLEGWQVIGAVLIIFVVVAPFIFPAPFAISDQGYKTAWEIGGQNDVRPDQPIWEDSLQWMASNTPAPGTLGNGNETKAMDPYDTHQRPPDDDYDYPEGAYGVQSWWDYGHWITVHGERIPNANPFQQGANEAANYLLAQNETEAAAALDAKTGDDGQTRYVMIDSQMVSPGQKFVMPTFKDNVSRDDFVNIARPITQDGVRRPLTLRAQEYYKSQMLRLYIAHGSAMDGQPIAFNTQQRRLQTQSSGTVEATVFRQPDGVETFNSTDEARRFVDENPNFKLRGIGANPPLRVDALEHYRLVHASSQTTRAISSQYEYGSVVKTFERVPGAPIRGEAPPESEVLASVEVDIPNTDQTFTYTQYATADENGNFEMTVPYSTTGYDNFGPDNGYTNVSVQAIGEYRFYVSQQPIGSAEVSEAQVLGVDDSPVQVALSQPTRTSRQSVQATG